MAQPLLPHRKAVIASIVILGLTLAILLWMGRPPICECGYVSLWHGDINSSGNSQHLADWYTPSHIIHGMIFYALGWFLFVKLGLGGSTRSGLGEQSAARWSFTLAVALEAAWEIAENTPMVIDRYRSVTVNWGYSGDSVINSMADLGWMSLGFFLALKLPVRVTVILAILMEVLAAFVVRDNLTLNVIMLIYPVDAIAQWQGMG
ncbi:DUF2585 family protein [Pontixanthobacter aquaemixtae]|uniref:DUF2585 family protein n=1 Tax=Pontixanthobacter aquaemixtae TaxID=1958940 RepID=A0A844ZVY7_9SPHN|nr:DUF2585 family protein [Pontixanthobacter aquaemixtae]MXO91888.1 DUF2585 family protein [Pontixanthobacter aquaemixtae]